MKQRARRKPVERDAAVVQSAADTGLGIPDDRVLGEISHEMGNYFHKLYYWTEYLRDRDGHDVDTDQSAVDMLETTVERLEHFMKMILEYFAPARLTFTSLKAEDLVLGLASRLAGRRLCVVGDAAVRATPVMADASLIGHAVRTVFEVASATLIDEDEMIVRLVPSQRREYRGIEIEFESGRGVSEGKSMAHGIELAVAEKFIQMHGGELFERNGADSKRALGLFLPIYA